jgi:cullin-associated NEDD8-dissociated protein 1
MAVSDLTKELEKEAYKPDAASQKKIVQGLVAVLTNDTASEVRSCVIKCLVPLIRKLGEDAARELFESLTKLLYEHKDETTRDLAGSGMKIMLESISPENAKVVIKVMNPKLINGAKDAAKADAVKDKAQMSLELLGELLSRFGKEMIADSEKIQEVVLPLISSKDSMNKKKAIVCLGYLSTVSSDKLFDDLMTYLTGAVSKTKEVGAIRTFVQAIGTLSRFAGNRMGKYVDKIFSMVKTYTDHKDFFVEEDKYDEELREICLQTLEALITRCPNELNSHLGEIEALSLRFIKHDPNRAGDEDEENDDAMDVDEDGGDDDDGDDDDDYEGDFDDEDDLSWKVRKSASRVLAALIRAYPSALTTFYGPVAKALVSRFNEDEDNVRMEVLSTFLVLLHQTAAIGIAHTGASVSLANSSGAISAATGAGGAGAGQSDHLAGLVALAPSVATQASKLLLDKHTKIPTRVSALQVLRQVMHVLQGGFGANLPVLVSVCPKTLAVKNATSVLKTEALLFLNALLTQHDASLFAKHTDQIWAAIEAAIKDSHYKIIAEGLTVCGQFVKVLTGGNVAPATTEQAKSLMPKIFTATHAKFVPNEFDKEVKEAAIGVMALEISRAGPLIAQTSVDECLKILVTRLGQEVVRAQVIKAIADIAASPLNISLASVVEPITETLTALLRQQSRALRTAAVTTLATLVQGGHLAAHEGHLEKIVGELASLIKPEEAHLTHLSLKLATAILQASPATAGTVATQLLEPSFALFHSTVLQGAMLESLVGFLVAGARTAQKSGNASTMTFAALSPRLIALGAKFDASSTSANARSFFSCLAHCLAGLVSASESADTLQSTVSKFLSDSSSSDLSTKLLAIYALGEIGRRVDLASAAGSVDVKAALLANLEASTEDAKAAAALALGGIAIGNLSKYLPEILAEVEKSPKSKYLLLSSVRELIVAQAKTPEGVAHLKPFFAPLSDLLSSHTKSEEEGIRNIVAECWGKLALTSPQEVFQVFCSKTTDENVHTRATVVAALKYAISTDATAHPTIDALLANHVTQFFDLLKDKEPSVRHAALLTFNYLSSHRPTIVRPVLAQYLPVLYGETLQKPELITIVKLGPFDHKVDNGLILRQAAYECMYTLLDTCLAQIELTPFTKTAYEAIKEEASLDNKSLKLLLLSKLTQRAPLAILASLEPLVAPLTEIINAKPNPEQQSERADELVRSAFRLVHAIQSIDGASQVTKWNDFVERVVNAGDNRAKYEAIKKEAK